MGYVNLRQDIIKDILSYGFNSTGMPRSTWRTRHNETDHKQIFFAPRRYFHTRIRFDLKSVPIPRTSGLLCTMIDAELLSPNGPSIGNVTSPPNVLDHEPRVSSRTEGALSHTRFSPNGSSIEE